MLNYVKDVLKCFHKKRKKESAGPPEQSRCDYCQEKLPSGKTPRADPGLLNTPTSEGTQSKSALDGECPDVEKMNGCPITFVINTGSQVTLSSRSLFEKYMKGTDVTSPDKMPGLKVCVTYNEQRSLP